jgi:hypothetical protein
MKRTLILCIAVLAAVTLNAQFHLGPKIGYTTSKLSTDLDDIKEDVKHNFQIGAFARFGKKLYLQPEVYYATSGGSLKVEGTSLEEEIKLKNIVVPALVGFHLINAKVINLRIFAGPVANFIIDKSVEADDLITDPLQDSNFKNVAWGLDAGAGIDVFFLTFDLRYELGLNNIFIPDSGEPEQKMKSNLFVVSLGFKII